MATTTSTTQRFETRASSSAASSTRTSRSETALSFPHAMDLCGILQKRGNVDLYLRSLREMNFESTMGGSADQRALIRQLMPGIIDCSFLNAPQGTVPADGTVFLDGTYAMPHHHVSFLLSGSGEVSVQTQHRTSGEKDVYRWGQVVMNGGTPRFVAFACSASTQKDAALLSRERSLRKEMVGMSSPIDVMDDAREQSVRAALLREAAKHAPADASVFES